MHVTNIIKGKVWRFGHDIDTDLIIPNFAIPLPRLEQPQFCFNANRPGWVNEVKAGDVLIAGRNFGVGSGRPIGDVFALLGIGAIIAESFNGLGLRNCINVGIPCLPCFGILDAFEEGDSAELDWTTGRVRNESKGSVLQGQPLPDVLQSIVQAGGVEVILRREGYLASSQSDKQTSVQENRAAARSPVNAGSRGS
jgi:3-isopropylmalate/(R)-2-methylmalate dehydratase small subunit